MKNLAIVLGFSTLFLTACVSHDDKTNGVPHVASNKEGIRCNLEKPIGSNMPRKRCTDLEQRKQEMENAEKVRIERE